MLETWGLLGGERLSGARRTRTLELGAAVREFNERAVPGLGGVWFGKQPLLATLGVVVAERARNAGAQVRNIEVANAIEALACWLAFKSNRWARDGRLRGWNKLQSKGTDFSFARAKQRNFYVTQPMRMSSVQALPSLGFAESNGVRFNAYSSTEIGRALVDLACDPFRPSNRTVVDHLTKWVISNRESVKVDTWQLEQALSPLRGLPREAIPVLVEGLRRDDALGSRRRANALDWVERIRLNRPRQIGWSTRPVNIDKAHWLDLEAGARFFAVRNAGIQVLDAMEADLANRTGKRVLDLENGALPRMVLKRLDTLRELAAHYLAMGHEQQEAAMFCQECGKKDRDVLRSLASRDGSVLRLVGSNVVPGAAFSHSAETTELPQDDPDAPSTSTLPLPSGLSHRMGKLYLLNLDMNEQLGSWLEAERESAARE